MNFLQFKKYAASNRVVYQVTLWLDHNGTKLPDASFSDTDYANVERHYSEMKDTDSSGTVDLKAHKITGGVLCWLASGMTRGKVERLKQV